MLAVAFKEWAVVCRALETGRQALILRKGGIAEQDGEFRPEHSRFWLYPTHFHEHRAGVRPELLPLLDATEADRPLSGTLRLRSYVEVQAVHFARTLESALRLAPFHGWTDDIVRQRFHYRSPGLYVLVARVSRMPQPFDLPELADYAGCKSWVPLARAWPTEGATPALDDAAFAGHARQIADALK